VLFKDYVISERMKNYQISYEKIVTHCLLFKKKSFASIMQFELASGTFIPT
jgi:hypothetical protein